MQANMTANWHPPSQRVFSNMSYDFTTLSAEFPDNLSADDIKILEQKYTVAKSKREEDWYLSLIYALKRQLAAY